MTVDRRGILAAGLGLGSTGLGGLGLGRTAVAGTTARADPADMAGPPPVGFDPARAMTAMDAGLIADSPDDQSKRLQAAIDTAAEKRVPLVLASGRYYAAGVTLRPHSIISGGTGAARLVLARPGVLINAEAAHGACLHDLAFDGGMMGRAATDHAVVALKDCADLCIYRIHVTSSGGNGLALEGCSGRVTFSRFSEIGDAAVFARNSTGLDITDNTIADCGNNGIQVWRSADGEDATIVARNRIARIAARSGGSGQNGNGINVFRAGSVIVEGNRISDCAYSAVRANAASNIQILANSCQRIGEVALYAEFGFEGALLASNLVEDAAAGITVTNFNVGGRLAVVQGNLIRNLKRREAEPVDKRGEGITVEADASVTGNTIENAPTAGLVIGWGRYMRDVIASGNLIRNARVGIAISSDVAAGACLVTGNMISGARDGAIRAMDQGRMHGPDLARESVATSGRVVVDKNMAV